MGRKQMKFHRVTIVISDAWLAEMARIIMSEQITSNWMPDILPAQDLAMTVCQAVKHELDMVTLPNDKEINKILDKIKEENK